MSKDNSGLMIKDKNKIFNQSDKIDGIKRNIKMNNIQMEMGIKVDKWDHPGRGKVHCNEFSNFHHKGNKKLTRIKSSSHLDNRNSNIDNSFLHQGNITPLDISNSIRDKSFLLQDNSNQEAWLLKEKITKNKNLLITLSNKELNCNTNLIK
mgnify:CR=1 FL=1